MKTAISKKNKKLLDSHSAYELLMKAREEIAKVIIGQEKVVDLFILAVISNGHILIEGAPGLAKTTIVMAISHIFNCEFKRIQFTPDLLPSDIVGINMYDKKTEKFEIQKGPIFCNLLLADEINRASSKVQSALLEAMAEKEVTIGGKSLKLAKPFLVFATENPVESLGTYALPQAQLDRFLFKILIDYPTNIEEEQIIKRTLTQESMYDVALEKVLVPEQIVKIQKMVKNVYMDKRLEVYIVKIIDATRKPKKYGLKLGAFIEWGVGPRGTISLIIASKAMAFFNNRDYVIDQDIKDIAYEVLRHRVLLNYEAQAKNISSENVIMEMLNKIDIFDEGYGL